MKIKSSLLNGKQNMKCSSRLLLGNLLKTLTYAYNNNSIPISVYRRIISLELDTLTLNKTRVIAVTAITTVNVLLSTVGKLFDDEILKQRQVFSPAYKIRQRPLLYLPCLCVKSKVHKVLINIIGRACCAGNLPENID